MYFYLLTNTDFAIIIIIICNQMVTSEIRE